MMISIAMATYNGENYLQEQLDSFVAQTRPPDELVVCDDGSSDGTLEVLREFADFAPFEVNIHQNDTNLGYVKNFEKAMSLCSGEIIFLSDQDDVWLQEKIKVIEREFKIKPKVQVVRSNMFIVDKELKNLGFSQLDNIIGMGGRSSNFNTGCGIACRREFLQLALPIPVNLWGHDLWLGVLSQKLDVSEIIWLPLMKYRRHGKNASRWLASDTKRLSPWDAVKQHRLKDARKGWKEEVMRLQDIEHRINERRVSISWLLCEEKMNQAIRNIENQRKRFSERITLCSKPRLVRIPFVVNLLIKGGYRQFSGWKSALKDVIRP